MNDLHDHLISGGELEQESNLCPTYCLLALLTLLWAFYLMIIIYGSSIN